jgi:hypothetical protein
LTLLFIFKVSFGFAQLQLDEDSWKEKREKHKYQTEQKKEDAAKADDSPFQNPVKNFNINSTAEAIKLGFFILIISVLLFLIYKFILNNTSNSANDEGLVFIEDLKEAEQNLMRADLQKLLDKCIDDKDYRSAIRVQYLQIIQLLSKQKRIKWAKDKTNFEYHKEIKDAPIAATFESTTLIYEKAWFGRQDISLERYNALTVYSDNLKSQING